MPRIQRNAKVLVLLLALVAASTGAWWVTAPPPAMTQLTVGQPAEPQPSPVTTAEAAALWGLLADVQLDREALVALNVSEAQAEALLTALRGWHDQNLSEAASAQTAVRTARAEVRRLQREVRMGTAEPQALTTAQAAVTAANQGYAGALTGLRTALSAELTESQRTTWAAIAHGWSSAMPLGMLPLTTQQRQDYATALRRYELATAAAESSEAQAALQTAWQQTVAGILTQDNQQAIDAYHEYAAAAAAAVTAAEQAVMPPAGQVG